MRLRPHFLRQSVSLLAVLALAACSKTGQDAPEAIRMSWTADSVPISAGTNLATGSATAAVRATVGSPVVSVSAGPTPMVTVVGTAGRGSSGTVTLRFPRRPGTFPLGGRYLFGTGGIDTTATATYSPASQPAGLGTGAFSGTIVATSVTATSFAGTFSFQTADGSSGSPRAFRITNGTFDAAL